jgi:aldose 1-epimerase
VEQIRCADGSLEVVVLPEAGARIHSLRAFGHELLRTPPDPARHLEDPFFWGAYVMAPWGGRIDATPTKVAGRTVDPVANFPDGTAIHGQVYGRPWQVDPDGSFRCVVDGPGWPWPYAVTFRVAVSDPSLTIDLGLTNRTDGPMPAGLGLHPWFRRPLDVAIDAGMVFTSNTGSAARPEPVAGRHDLRSLGPIPDDLDATWAAVEDPAVRLRWPEIGVQATMRIEAPAVFVVAASPASLGAVAVEPQTHAPQGLRRVLAGEPGGLTMLGPGHQLALRARLTFERVGP